MDNVKFGLDDSLINAVKEITEASCKSKKMEQEELHPNQKKLDKNKNGKLDSQDFKMLRKEESEEELDEATEYSHSQLMKKFKDGTHEALQDVKPGKHVEIRNTSTGKRTTVFVKPNIVKEDVELTQEQLDEIQALATKHGLGE